MPQAPSMDINKSYIDAMKAFESLMEHDRKFSSSIKSFEQSLAATKRVDPPPPPARVNLSAPAAAPFFPQQDFTPYMANFVEVPSYSGFPVGPAVYPPPTSTGIELHLKLRLDARKEINMAEFVGLLLQDLSSSSRVPPTSFQVLSILDSQLTPVLEPVVVGRDSVYVIVYLVGDGVNPPQQVCTDLKQQMNDPESRLLNGLVTSQLLAVTSPSVRG
eukprot:716813-Hanusia_phi.AAC.3